MRTRRGGLVGAALALSLLALGACGSSSVSAPSTAPSTSATTTTATSAPAVRSSSSVEGTEIDRLPPLPPSSIPSIGTQPTPLSVQATFLRTVFDDVQATWAKDFQEAGLRYRPARLVLFDSGVETACGAQTAAVGPFYCAGDATVYLDQRFFRAMLEQLGVTSEFAPAYIVAHEVAHHVQAVLGITHRVAAATEQHPAGANALSVRVELQADCLAGVWTHSTGERDLLRPEDLDGALQAAGAVGDDFLARRSGSETAPEDWTHGSSAQRQEWLKRGFETGTPDACDTFSP